MPTTEQPYDLAELAGRYEILGELAGHDGATTFIARRRADSADAQIVVFTAPQGDEGNALSHLAADVNLLAGAMHPGLVPILEGAWVGREAFAVVMRRATMPTLEELLSKREEQFSLPRIAALLSQINGTIAWARERKVVHRSVTPRTIFIEAGTDRPCVAFIARALPLTDMPGPEEDGRTIAQLARAMLTRGGGPAGQERAEQPLGELRPGLPTVVITQTEQLLSPSRGAAPDVIGYIGAIAMADALKAGEEHLEQTRNQIETQKREHQAQLEQERREHDEQLAEERASHQKAVDDQAKRFQKERDDYERQLKKDNDALAKERAALAAEREAHQRDCDRLMRERDEFERENARVREQLEWETAALATQQEMYARTDEYRTPEPDERPPVVPARATARRFRPPRPARPWHAGGGLFGRPVVMAAGVATLIVVIALVVGAVNRGRDARPARPALTAETSRARVVDSVGGVIEPVPAVPGAGSGTAQPDTAPVGPSERTGPGVPADLLSSVAARADSTPQIPWWRRVLRRDRDTAAAPRATAPADTAPRLDTIFAFPPVRPRGDSILRRDSLRRDSLRRDTLSRDTSVMRDTTRRDTLVARDTVRLGAR
jgi:hypothetical protein